MPKYISLFRHRPDRVVLVGGGSTAALTALRLAEQGYAVSVLEKAHIGNGSSSRSAACIRAQFSMAETATGMRYSEWWYEHFNENLSICDPNSGTPVIEQNGYLFLYENPDKVPPWKPSIRRIKAQAWAQAQKNAAMHCSLGIPVEVIDPQDVHRRWKHIVPDQLIGATYCPSDGFLRPNMIYNEAFRRARELGVVVREGVEVTGAKIRGDRIIHMETNLGPVEAEWFVNCTNAWAPRLSRALRAMELPISPLKRYLYFLQPDPSRAIMDPTEWKRLPMTIYGVGAGRGAYSRPDSDLLMMGMAHETDPEQEFADKDQDAIRPGFDFQVGLENFGFEVLQQIEDFAPALAGCGRITSMSSGFYGTTSDSNPLIGIDSIRRNLVHAAGFSGHGLMHAPITAVLVEAILLGKANKGRVRLPSPFNEHVIDLARFDPSRRFETANAETLVL